MGVGLFLVELQRRCPLVRGRPSVGGLIPPLSLSRPVVGNCARSGAVRVHDTDRHMAVLKEEKFHPFELERNPSTTTQEGEKQGEVCFYVQLAEVFLES